MAKAATKKATTATKTKRTSRSKFLPNLMLCTDCTRTAKKEIVGIVTPSDQLAVNQDEKLWVRCTKCHNTMIVNMTEIKAERELSRMNVALEDCTPYAPSKTFAISEAIYHADWNDVGTVVSKEIMSNGMRAIIVRFEKLGQKKLIENFVNN